MNNIYIKAYANKNLGDDLFLKILAERYKKTNFALITGNNYENILPKNIKIISGLKYKVCNKMMKMTTKYYLPIEKYVAGKSDAIIQIGGSLFMENTTRNWKYDGDFLYKKIKKEYFILGSNFGPFYSNDYKEYYKDIFEKSEDVCFREKYSMNLFNDVDKVRCASDIVFSLQTEDIDIKTSKKVVMSIIDCDKKIGREYKENYEKLIIDLTNYFINKGYEVTYMSFCKNENDEAAIESIFSRINDYNKKNITKYFYRGDIHEALNILADCQIVVGSRFHANILGLLFNKTIIPIAYSEKTINVLDDIGFKGIKIKISELEKFDIACLTDEQLNYKCDISFQVKDSQRQFEILDKILY